MKSDLINLTGNFENLQKHYNLYSRYVKNGDYCIDIGTNCGSATIPMILLHGDTGKTIGFEPNKRAFEYLNSNLNQNGLSKYSDTYNFAIADTYCEKEYISSPSSDNGGFTEGFTLKERGSLIPSYKVNCVPLKSFLDSHYKQEEIKKIALIKIDCEGYDSEILDSLSGLLKVIQPVIIMEWWFDDSRNDRIFDSIDNAGYNAYRSDNFQLANRSQFSYKSDDLVLIKK